MAILTDLPTELLQCIVSHLGDSEPLSTRHLHEEPSDALLNCSYHPIKDLSLTCNRLYQVTFPILFNNLRVSIDSIDAVLRFVALHSLATKVSTLLLHATLQQIKNILTLGTSTFLYPSHRTLALIDGIDPNAVTILFPPAALEYILPYSLRLSDEWAFNVPYQTLHLSYDRSSVCPTPDADQGPLTHRNILQIRPWTYCAYNEGSSIRAYSTYEYFHKRGPSLINGLHPVSMFCDIQRSLSHLTSFDFIAVFPFPHHQAHDGHTHRLVEFLSRVTPNLRHLRVQLVPTSRNSILEDAKALVTCQRSAPWTEFILALGQLMELVTEGSLKRLTSLTLLDYKNSRLRDLIDGITGSHASTGERTWTWKYEGDGRWVKTEWCGAARVDES